MNPLKAFLNKINPPAPTPLQRVRPDYIRWDGLRQGWGRAVIWHSGLDPQGIGPTGSISGFDPIRDPRVGDVFETKMQSGRTIIWVVDRVESLTDPNDMYHADLLRIGYEDENPLPVSIPEGASLVIGVRRAT